MHPPHPNSLPCLQACEAVQPGSVNWLRAFEPPFRQVGPLLLLHMWMSFAVCALLFVHALWVLPGCVVVAVPVHRVTSIEPQTA